MIIKSQFSAIKADEEKVLRKVLADEGLKSESEIRKDLILINDLLSIRQLYSGGSKRKMRLELEKRINQDVKT